MSIQDYLQLAAETAISRMDQRHHRLAAIGIRSDGTVVRSSNGPTPEPCRHTHAEYKLSRKLDYGATVIVIRLKRDGTFGMARPCGSCRKILISKRVKKVYFTNHSGDIESMDLT